MKYLVRVCLMLWIGLCAEVNAHNANKHFVIIIPSRNNSQWCERNLEALRTQSYDNWHAIYINDASTDDTREKVEQFIKTHRLEHKITLINNEERQGALCNIYKAVYMCDDSDVIVTYDGDDWFSGSHALETLNRAYLDENVWLTYGSYMQYPSGEEKKLGALSDDVIESGSYRSAEWCTTHLRTFYAWLFKSIKKEDLKIDGAFFQTTWDLAFMFPMLEMAAGRFKYIPEILYVYNIETPYNDSKIHHELQLKMEDVIRSRPAYQPLATNQKPHHFAVIIPSRNNSQWCERNLEALRTQSYDNWHAIYINDASTDDTKEKVEQFIKMHGLEHKITLINNAERQGAMANIYKAVYMCKDSDIAISYDGDDWFSGPHALAALNKVYADENIWLTYGSYQDHPSGDRGQSSSPIPEEVIASNSYRADKWHTSHLRTFYVWLFKSIKTEDLKVGGAFFPMTYDQAIMFPMLEMAAGRFKYISDTLYVYNMETSYNDHKVDQALQKKMELIIRSRPAYQALKRNPLNNESLHEKRVPEPLKSHEAWWQDKLSSSMNQFEGWLGDENALSRVQARNHIVSKNYQSILDVPCGLGTEFYGYKNNNISIGYQGIDITPLLVERAQKLGINVTRGTIENIAREDSAFDVTYARHILEHLDYYELAINELIRVAKREALIIFFIPPHNNAPDTIVPAQIDGHIIYHNRYNKQKLEAYILNNPKVDRIEWEPSGDQEVILHIVNK